MNSNLPNRSLPELNHCPQCGTPRPAGPLADLCPACRRKHGAAADAGPEGAWHSCRWAWRSVAVIAIALLVGGTVLASWLRRPHVVGWGAPGSSDERSNALIAVLAPTDTPVFGPVMERELVGGRALANAFLDLDTGRVLSAPKELIESLARQGQLKEGSPPTAPIAEWARNNGVDIVKRVLRMPEGTGPFDTALSQLEGVATGVFEFSGEQDNQDRLEPLMLDDVIRALDKAEMTLGHRPTATGRGLYAMGPDFIWAVRTREGSIALVTIDPDLPSGNTRVRYRLARVAAGSSDTKFTPKLNSSGAE